MSVTTATRARKNLNGYDSSSSGGGGGGGGGGFTAWEEWTPTAGTNVASVTLTDRDNIYLSDDYSVILNMNVQVTTSGAGPYSTITIGGIPETADMSSSGVMRNAMIATEAGGALIICHAQVDATNDTEVLITGTFASSTQYQINGQLTYRYAS